MCPPAHIPTHNRANLVVRCAPAHATYGAAAMCAPAHATQTTAAAICAPAPATHAAPRTLPGHDGERAPPRPRPRAAPRPSGVRRSQRPSVGDAPRDRAGWQRRRLRPHHAHRGAHGPATASRGWRRRAVLERLRAGREPHLGDQLRGAPARADRPRATDDRPLPRRPRLLPHRRRGRGRHGRGAHRKPARHGGWARDRGLARDVEHVP